LRAVRTDDSVAGIASPAHNGCVVFSHWVEGLCVASTPVTVADAAMVARFLSGVLPAEAGPSAAD
jgi:hypothetical protein